MLAEPSEVVGGRFLAGPRRPQLLQPLAEQIGGLGMVEDVIAEGRLVGELRRGVRPAADHLHQLDLEIAVIRQSLGVLLDREASAKFASVYDRHVGSPLGSRSRFSRLVGQSVSRRLVVGVRVTTRCARSVRVSGGSFSLSPCHPVTPSPISHHPIPRLARGRPLSGLLRGRPRRGRWLPGR